MADAFPESNEGCSCDTCLKIKPIVQCPVCLDTLKDPRSLLCGHTLCFDCIIGLTVSSPRLLKCPVCRFNQQITSADTLPRSLLAAQTIEVANQVPGSPQVRRSFVACQGSSCVKILDLEELMYCGSHEKILCVRCGLENHKSCSTKLASSYGRERMEAIIKEAQSAQDSLGKMQEKLQAVRKYAEQLIAFSDGELRKVGDTVDSLVEARSALTAAQGDVAAIFSNARCKEHATRTAAVEVFVNQYNLSDIDSAINELRYMKIAAPGYVMPESSGGKMVIGKPPKKLSTAFANSSLKRSLHQGGANW